MVKEINMKNFIAIFSLLTLLVVSVVSQAEIVYIHNDALGSPIMETNELGTVNSRTHYKPFGETLEPMKEGVGYTGHLNDTDLGLTYMQARYYDPVIGRFYSNDPVGFKDIHSFNRYSYANNNPYKYTDPDGREVVPVGTPAQIEQINAALTKIEGSGFQPRMRLLSMKKSSNVHTIRFPKKGERAENKTTGIKKNEKNGIGTGSETIVDVTKSIKSFSGESVLVHELLGHGYDKDNGKMDRTEVDGTKISETRAVEIGDQYRKGVGEDARKDYKIKDPK